MSLETADKRPLLAIKKVPCYVPSSFSLPFLYVPANNKIFSICNNLFLLTFVQIYTFLTFTSCLSLPFPFKTTLDDIINSFPTASFAIAIVVIAIFFFLNVGTLTLSKLALSYLLSLSFMCFIRSTGSLSY